MMTTLKIEIDCGKSSCASEPGRFCRFLGSRRMGTIYVCMLFPMDNPGKKDPGSLTDLKSTDGWIQRCPACLKAEVQAEQNKEEKSICPMEQEKGR